MNNNMPVFMQIMEMIEDGILSGVYKTDDIIISTTQISKLLSVNPTTSVKAVSNLTNEGILYKKRGIGMCVAQGAKEKIFLRRKEAFMGEIVPGFLNEAKKLGITQDELIRIIRSKNND
ncbi:MAG TPA: GntR family transcriptional regulator [Ruminiclostridium sp.]|nr:GntR family transcriptional regulator [Ruminiclostridium sp.]